MAQHYPHLDFGSFLPAYHTDPPPSYYNPPPSYSSPHHDQKNTVLISSFPDDGISFPPPTSVQLPARDSSRSSSRITIAHPYARLYAKKDGSKRRKIWNHVLEKQLFSPQELSVHIIFPFSSLIIPLSDPPWAPPTGVQFISPPSKPISTGFIISYSALAYIPFHSNALNPIAASTQRQQRYPVSLSPLSLVPIHVS